MKRIAVITKSEHLHILLSPNEARALWDLSERLKVNRSSVIRLLIRSAILTNMQEDDALILIDRSLASSLNRNIRALGYLLNQSTKSLNTIAKVIREGGVDAMDLTEALELVSCELREIDREADALSTQMREVSNRKVILG